MKINLYDFDNTIYKGDSSRDFFFYSLMKYPRIIRRIPKLLKMVILYLLKKCTRTELKESFYQYLNDIPDIDSHVFSFWATHSYYIKDFYLKKKHDKDIIISASPEFLLKPIIAELEVLDFMGSKVNKKTGKYTGLNCYGEEKVKRLNKKYSDYQVLEAYSDSKSDIPILKLAKKQFLVKGDKIKPVKF